MSLRENLMVSKHALEIIDRDLKDNKEKILVTQILNNYYTRGLLWEIDHETSQGVTDETIAVTELIVLTNCLRNLHCETKTQNGSLEK